MNKQRKSRVCPYCGAETKIADPKNIKSLTYTNEIVDKKKVLVCSNYPKCSAYVLFDNANSDSPGIVANAYLRILRIKTHLFFDIIWKTKITSRENLYNELSEYLGINRNITHIKYFDIDDCINTILYACKYMYYDFSKIKTYSSLDDKQLKILHRIIEDEFPGCFTKSDFKASDLRKAISCIFDTDYMKVFSINVKQGTCSFKRNREVTVYPFCGKNMQSCIKDINKQLYNEFAKNNGFNIIV